MMNKKKSYKTNLSGNDNHSVSIQVASYEELLPAVVATVVAAAATAAAVNKYNSTCSCAS
jgi:hypothetical protein